MTSANRSVYYRILFHSSLLGILLSLLVYSYDSIFGTLLHSIHLFMEVLEQLLDNFIEHQFHTDRRQTQFIVFYTLLVFGGVMLVLCFRYLVTLCRRCCCLAKQDYLDLKNVALNDWSALSTLHKVLWVGGLVLVNYLFSFLLF